MSHNPIIRSFFYSSDLDSLKTFLKWYEERKKSLSLKIKRIKLKDCNGWEFDKLSSTIRHKSGKFFSVLGLEVRANFNTKKKWEQLIIDQPEAGILGIISKIINEKRYFLMQAKVEPGNINSIQLSPTLQATRSNYTKAHGGNSPDYLDYFLQKKGVVIVDQLQPEQAGRFLKKRNRNMVIEINEEIEIKENFIWLTMHDLKNLSKIDNLLNMDSRTVLACLNFFNDDIDDFKYVLRSKKSLFLKKMVEIKEFDKSISQVLRWIDEIKTNLEFETKKLSLDKMKNWNIKDDGIFNRNNNFFSLEYFLIHAKGREVSNWSQPLFVDKSIGLTGFLMNEKFELLFQVKAEAGAFHKILLYPTISVSKFNLDNQKVNFREYFINPDVNNILINSIQSEEGGRFYKLLNKNMLVKTKNILKIPENFIWLNFFQTYKMIELGYISIESRSILGLIDFNEL